MHARRIQGWDGPVERVALVLQLPTARHGRRSHVPPHPAVCVRARCEPRGRGHHRRRDEHRVRPGLHAVGLPLGPPQGAQGLPDPRVPRDRGELPRDGDLLQPVGVLPRQPAHRFPRRRERARRRRLGHGDLAAVPVAGTPRVHQPAHRRRLHRRPKRRCCVAFDRAAPPRHPERDARALHHRRGPRPPLGRPGRDVAARAEGPS